MIQNTVEGLFLVGFVFRHDTRCKKCCKWSDTNKTKPTKAVYSILQLFLFQIKNKSSFFSLFISAYESKTCFEKKTKLIKKRPFARVDHICPCKDSLRLHLHRATACWTCMEYDIKVNSLSV